MRRKGCNICTNCNLQSANLVPSVTQSSLLNRFVFRDPQFAGNCPDSFLDFNLSARNSFSQKIFVGKAIDDKTLGLSSTTSLYFSVDLSQYFWSSSCVLPKALEWLPSPFSPRGEHLFQFHFPERISLRVQKTMYCHPFPQWQCMLTELYFEYFGLIPLALDLYWAEPQVGVLWHVGLVWWTWSSLSPLSIGRFCSGVFWPKGCSWLVGWSLITSLLGVFWSKSVTLHEDLWYSR